jgi:8-oxo-dGTP pyrophosphatase MutT (NUDIX family)
MTISHRVSVILAHEGRLLLQNLRTKENPEYVFLGGHVEPGETVFECVAREMREELNVGVRPLRICYFLENFWMNKGRLVHEHTFFVLAEFERPEDAASGFPERETNIEPEFIPMDHVGQVFVHPAVVQRRFLDDRKQGFPLVHLVVGHELRPNTTGGA